MLNLLILSTRAKSYKRPIDCNVCNTTCNGIAEFQETYHKGNTCEEEGNITAFRKKDEIIELIEQHCFEDNGGFKANDCLCADDSGHSGEITPKVGLSCKGG